MVIFHSYVSLPEGTSDTYASFLRSYVWVPEGVAVSGWILATAVAELTWADQKCLRESEGIVPRLSDDWHMTCSCFGNDGIVAVIFPGIGVNPLSPHPSRGRVWVAGGTWKFNSWEQLTIMAMNIEAFPLPLLLRIVLMLPSRYMGLSENVGLIFPMK